MDEVPNATADEAIGALVSLGGLDELLLNGADLSPHAAKPGVLLPIGTCHEAGVIWTKRGGEHACTPRPVHVDNLQLAAAAVRGLVLEQHLVNVFDVLAGHNAHLLTRVGDLGDRRDGPLIRLLAGRLNARVVAVTHRKDPGVALVICSPRLALASLHSEVHVLMAEDKRPQAIPHASHASAPGHLMSPRPYAYKRNTKPQVCCCYLPSAEQGATAISN